jgi:hypothetical protein
MKVASRRGRRAKRSLEPVAWGALPVLALGIGVLASGVGIDLLVLAVGCLFLLTLDRTVGDWLAETLGSGPGTVAFGVAVVGFTWYFLSYPSDEFFAAAEKRGYRTAYYERTPASADVAAESVGAPGGAYVQSAVAPSSGGTGGSGTGAVLNTEPRDNESARLEGASEADRAKEGADGSKPSERPQSENPSDRAPGRASAARVVFGAKEAAPAPIPTRIVLTLFPAQVPAARRTSFQGVVTADGLPVTDGRVQFTVNGTGAGRAALDARGVATVTFATHIAGTYEVRARFSGTSTHDPSSSGLTTLRVIQP